MRTGKVKTANAKPASQTQSTYFFSSSSALTTSATPELSPTRCGARAAVYTGGPDWHETRAPTKQPSRTNATKATIDNIGICYGLDMT